MTKITQLEFDALNNINNQLTSLEKQRINNSDSIDDVICNQVGLKCDEDDKQTLFTAIDFFDELTRELPILQEKCQILLDHFKENK